jgi:Protein of unknown function (DUF3048) C-terminal domain/Protein of unknown function (DUF3048) N-terminal domain
VNFQPRGAAKAATAAAALCAAATVLAACSSGSGAAGPTGSSAGASPTQSSASPSQSPSTAPAAAATSPLTGQPASAAVLARPAVVVVVAVGTGRTVRGVAQADVVYQEFDHPGTSRLVAAYQTQDAVVGPVTTTSPADPRVMSLMGLPVFAFNGGSTGFVKQVGPTIVTARPAASFVSLFAHLGGVPYASTAALRASAPTAAPAPQGLLSFTGPTVAQATGVHQVTRVSVAVPGQSTEHWVWTGRGWAGPAGTTVTNIVVQYVPYKKLTPSKGPSVESAQIVGTGLATVVGGTSAATCTWSRPQLLNITNYYDAKALPVALTPGRTWVVYAPPGTKVTTS